MNLYSFILYFNNKTLKIDMAKDCFAREFIDENGELGTQLVHADGHDRIIQALKKNGVDILDMFILGIFGEDKERGKMLVKFRLTNNFSFNNVNIREFAKKNRMTILQSREFFSTKLIDFIDGKISYDEFENLIQERILFADRKIKLYKQKRQMLNKPQNQR